MHVSPHFCVIIYHRDQEQIPRSATSLSNF